MFVSRRNRGKQKILVGYFSGQYSGVHVNKWYTQIVTEFILYFGIKFVIGKLSVGWYLS